MHHVSNSRDARGSKEELTREFSLEDLCWTYVRFWDGKTCRPTDQEHEEGVCAGRTHTERPLIDMGSRATRNCPQRGCFEVCGGSYPDSDPYDRGKTSHGVCVEIHHPPPPPPPLPVAVTRNALSL